jgi:hypothetical protein
MSSGKVRELVLGSHGVWVFYEVTNTHFYEVELDMLTMLSSNAPFARLLSIVMPWYIRPSIFKMPACYSQNSSMSFAKQFQKFTEVCPPHSSLIFHSTPFLANSTFLPNSPSCHPPLLPQIAIPSPSSALSSTLSHAQGQWCGKCTQDSVPGQR